MSLSSAGPFLSKIGRKYLKISCPNITNPDKLQLVNYSCIILKIFKYKNFGRENFDDSTSIRQIHQTFPPSKFALYSSKSTGGMGGGWVVGGGNNNHKDTV